MKKTFITLILLLMGGFTTAFAGNIAVEQLSTPYGQCNSKESKDINYYLQNELRQKPKDSFYNTHSYGTLPRRTSNAIQLWTNGVLSSCQDWGLESNFSPASNSGSKYVIFQNHDACVFRKPNYTKEKNPDRLDAQIHYKIAYSYVMPNGDKSGTFPWYYRKNGENVYRCAANNEITNQTSTCPKSEKKYDSKIYQHLGECLNYRVFWCGDGLLNGQQGNTDYENGTFTEQCDPKDPKKAGWGDGGCDASCKPITKPKPEPQCNSQYHGKVGYASHYPPTPWLHTGMNLCNPGQIVDFQGPDAQGFFAWKCKGEAGTSIAECQARQERCGDGKKNGPEQCDPKDSKKRGWGKGGCDATCKPIHREDPKVYDLALTKKLATKKTSYELGDLVDFEITVYNQGELSAKNIEITEYLPNGLLLEDTKWTQNGNKASFLIRETILPRQYKTIKLRMRIADNFTGTKILNKAEISKDNAGDYGTTDSDSTPDQNADNDCIVGEDNHYIDGNGKAGGACTPVTDEDDHDIVPILIKKPDLPVVPPYIEKELQGDKNHKYQVGELVGFKMPFGNTGSQMIKKVKIRDILPLNLEYVSSEIHGVQPYTKGLYASGKLQILEYSGFNLAPGQQGYLLMTGRVLADYQDARVNRVGIYENDYLRDWDDESYQIAPKAVKIEKTVDKSQVFSGEVVEFTIKVSATEGKCTTLKVVDTLPKGLVFVPDTQLLTGQTTETKLVSFATGVNGSGLETLTWELNFPKGFKKSDFFLLKLKAKLLETSKTTYTNIACVFNPDDPQNPSCDPEDVKPRLEDVKLKIKKYVSDAVGGTWIDDSKQFSNGATAFFKLVISSASAPLTGFRVTDRIEGNLSYLDSSDLANNAFTGLITFGANNPTKPAYTITPKVTTGANFTDLEWKVSMGSGFFMPGDSLVVIFKTKKNGNQTNIGHVYYPRPNGGEGHDQDPASVTTPSGWGGGGWGWGGRSGGGGSSCGNGTQNGFEFCDRGSQNGSKIIRKGERLFRDDASPVSDYEGEYRCTSSCTLERRGTNALPACFNTQNGSISIMKGEMLPFYWNIEGMLGKRSEQEKIDYLKKSFFLSSNGECREKDIGKIDLTTMECTFAVYGPGKSNSKVVSAFTTDCINVDGWSKGNGDFYPAIKSFVEQNKKGWLGGSMLNHHGGQRNVFDSLDNWEYPTLMPLSSKLIISNFGTPSAKLIGKERTDLASKDIQTFGEYKLSLEQMKYKTCISAVDKEKKNIYKLSDFHPGYERVCEVDFAVTAPYLIQKSPYGIGNKATDALGKYRLKNGTSFMDEYFKTERIDAKAYEAPKNMQKLFMTFKNKYQKLARTVKGKSDLSKVPGKSIYFYAGNEELTAVLGAKVIEKPFTLIASKGQDLKIKGNLLTNAMIMTSGKIIFDAEGSCNGDIRTYGHAGQMVKGIFYAGQGFGSINHEQLKNTYENISKKERCNYGNLHIKGVAIGDLSKVVEARRSELYTWFNAASSKGTAKKKDIVVNGASVLVEYNPSLRGQLPPGAEEFNKALQIYRK